MSELVLAVDIGGTKLAVGRVDGDGVLTDQRAVPTPAGGTADGVWAWRAGGGAGGDGVLPAQRGVRTPAGGTADELWAVLAGLVSAVWRGGEAVVGAGCG